jgi:hypothetical protein
MLRFVSHIKIDGGQEKKGWKDEPEEVGETIQGIIGILALCVYGLKPESVD